jgi:hypothetical protein
VLQVRQVQVLLLLVRLVLLLLVRLVRLVLVRLQELQQEPRQELQFFLRSPRKKLSLKEKGK